MLDIIAIGDPTIDTILAIHDATVTCRLDHEDCKIAFDYAEKIPVDKLDRKIAGNACNNAVGSARLGMKTAYYMIVGDDARGDNIQKKLIKEGVKKYYFVVDEKNPTNASTVINFNGERTIFVYHAPRKYSLPKLKKSKWIYYSSVNKGHKNLNTQIIKHVQKTSAKLCYNPGTYQRLAGTREMRRVVKHCEIVFLNKEEAQALTQSAIRNITPLLKIVHKLGAKIAVITDGPKGSYVYDGEKTYRMGVLKTRIVERTGAGDAYATTFIAMLNQGHSIEEAMCFATTNSSSVIMKQGPQDGLLTKKQLIAFHKKYKHECARVV